MASHTRLLYHVTFATKHRQKTLVGSNRRRLFAYMLGILRKKNCHLYRLNGVEDHVHILLEIHQSIAVADLVRDLKTSATSFIKSQRLFPSFVSWQEGYAAFTESWGRKDQLIEYIKGQEQHHAGEDYVAEYKRLCSEAGLVFEEQDLD